MVYGIVGMINFAHGDIFMIGGFIIALISFLVLVSFGLTGGARDPLDRAFWCRWQSRPCTAGRWSASPIGRLRHSFRLAPMLSAIGMSFVAVELLPGGGKARRVKTGAADHHRRLYAA